MVEKQLTAYDQESPGVISPHTFYLYNIVKYSFQAEEGGCDKQVRQFATSTQTTPSSSSESSREHSPERMYPDLQKELSERKEKEKINNLETELLKISQKLKQLELRKNVSFKEDIIESHAEYMEPTSSKLCLELSIEIKL